MKQEEIAGKIALLKAEIGKILVGQHEVVDQVLQAIFAWRTFALMMGVLGLAKTLLVSTLSQKQLAPVVRSASSSRPT